MADIAGDSSQIAPDVVTTVVGTHYQRLLAMPDGARSRAQAGYGIAAAIAAALVAAGIFGNLDQRTTLVQILGLTSLLAWFGAAGLYLIAVSRPFQSAAQQEIGSGAFVQAALDAAEAERYRIDKWQNRAAAVSAIAAALTAAALVASLVDTPSRARAATVVLNEEGAAAVSEACGGSLKTVTGTVAPDDLAKAFVPVRLASGVCGSGAAVVMVPQGTVQAVALMSASHGTKTKGGGGAPPPAGSNRRKRTYTGND